jgi:PilZ domain
MLAHQPWPPVSFSRSFSRADVWPLFILASTREEAAKVWSRRAKEAWMHARLLPYVPRRPSRHAIRLACQIVRERDFKLVSREIVEVSESGLLVRPEERVLTGENLIVSFMAPFSRTFIDVEAIVARVIHGRRLTDGGPALGIQFQNLDPVSRAMLVRHLEGLPVRAPHRRMLS